MRKTLLAWESDKFVLNKAENGGFGIRGQEFLRNVMPANNERLTPISETNLF